MLLYTKDDIKQLLLSNDRAVERAILAIFERQLASLGLRASANERGTIVGLHYLSQRHWFLRRSLSTWNLLLSLAEDRATIDWRSPYQSSKDGSALYEPITGDC